MPQKAQRSNMTEYDLGHTRAIAVGDERILMGWMQWKYHMDPDPEIKHRGKQLR
jgi:hypothetical protein